MSANQIINPNKIGRRKLNLLKKISSGYLAITLSVWFACKHCAYQWFLSSHWNRPHTWLNTCYNFTIFTHEGLATLQDIPIKSLLLCRTFGDLHRHTVKFHAEDLSQATAALLLWDFFFLSCFSNENNLLILLLRGAHSSKSLLPGSN